MSDETSAEGPADVPVEDSPEAGKRKGKGNKKHTVGAVLLASMVVLALVTGLSVAFIYRHLNGNITISDAFDEVDNAPEDLGPKGALNILVLGSDTRDGENDIGDGEAGGGVSDTTILLHISADRERAYGISIPRDSLVTRPDCGKDNEIGGGENQMWNAAYALGGEACTIEQFNENTTFTNKKGKEVGIRLDDFVIIDFAGFKDMVDAVDGVPVCIPEDIDDPAHDIFIEAGEEVVLKGDEALNYVRVRYTLGDGSDIGRIKRQQNFIASMVNKVVSKGTLARPDRLVGFLDAATQSLTVSPGLRNLTKLGGLALSLQDVGLDKVQFLTVPWEYDQREEYRGRVVWKPEAKKIWKKLAKDKPLSRRQSAGAINAQAPPGLKPTPTQTPSATPTEQPTQTPSETPSLSPSPSPTPSVTQGPSDEEVAEARANGLCA
ncbi:LCP family protein [Nocardioides campestrisoli]|uniref:LCP family protein n=1 Tax=Nocardioides campestrisoli TaxID=2736757 RepID=UPI001CD5B7BA|nr:LCP family protein [Nocardioides campestrisoli]